MKLCAIQQPYPYTPEECPEAIEFLISELESCDESLDVILLPEYSNCPTAFPSGAASRACAVQYTDRLVAAARGAAKRCHAIVGLSFMCEVKPGVYRNTTRIYDREGKVAGDYYKQQLTNDEPRSREVDNSYALDYLPPAIVEVDGIRLGFVICYDAYYDEYAAHLAYRKPDLVLVSSHQRGERFDILEMLNRSLAFHTNAFVLRASVGMGEGKEVGGSSMVVDPSGIILANSKGQNGKLICEVGDIHRKYLRTDSFRGKMITNDWFIEKGRTPWSYRACGSSVKLDDGRMGYPRICAHRGFNTVAPENSLAAFGAAIGLGAEEIELDLWKTLDGVPVVMHDPTLERVSNGQGSIMEKTLAELKALDFGSAFGPEYAGLKIATFEEVLKRFPRQAIINIHIKSQGDEACFDRAFLREIVRLVRDYDCLNHVYVCGRADIMEGMIEVAPEIRRCMGAGPDPSDLQVVARAIKYGCSKVQFMKPYYSKELIAEAHAHGIRCNMFWSDDVEEARGFLRDGIDTILTNDYWRVAQAVRG